MPHGDESLRSLIARARHLPERSLHGIDHSIAWDALEHGSSLDCGVAALAGCAALVLTTDQLTSGLAMIELDGVARRLVLCPPDLPADHLPLIVQAADIDVIVSDTTAATGVIPERIRWVRCGAHIAAAPLGRDRGRRTEWVLLTSGTTGLPKLVVHTLASLIGAIKPGGNAPAAPRVWSTFYDLRRYGGLQIFLRAALGGASLVLSSAREGTADFLARAGDHAVTHISGTPSHWRRALMSSSAGRIAPQYVRLSGEIADQAILDDLAGFYPSARVGHAFASTEAGVAFEVDDGLAGFPASLIGRQGAEVEMKIADGSLRIRSARTARGYLGGGGDSLRDADGFIDTGDMVERRDDRYYFIGRRGGIINVGGLKFYPEEVEAVINRHPAVRMSLVKARKNPFTGQVVVADVVIRPNLTGDPAAVPSPALQGEIIAVCRRDLPQHKVPAAIRFVPSLEIAAPGKLVRRGE